MFRCSIFEAQMPSNFTSMNVSTQLLFFFSGLGAFNGALLSLYFLFGARPKHLSNIFLGALLSALSIRIGKSVFFFFNPHLAPIYLQIGLSACFFIGPFLFFFVQSKLSDQPIKPYWKIILPVLLVITLIVGIRYPFKTHFELWRPHIIHAIYYFWGICILATAYLMQAIFQKIITRTKLEYREVWVLNVFLGVTAIWVAYFTSSYTSYIMGALSFSFVLYLSILVLIAYRGEKNNADKEKYANKKIEASDAQALQMKIQRLMEEQAVYKDPNLTLPKLAKKLNISPHLLSQLLNDNLNKRFSQFINEYRIDEAKRLLHANHHLKMEAIAEQCGFNSNSTFYTAFKKFTGTTPAKYMSER